MKLESLAWLTWRQHRVAIVSVGAVAALAIYGLTTTESNVLSTNNSMPIAGFYALMVQLSFGALVGMFWGAPLIARELEERTYFVAWGQDVTPVQWLRGKLIVFGVLAVLLGALVGNGDGFVGSVRSWHGFEANSLVQAGYAVLGLSIGLLIGLLSRHVVTAMAATFVAYVAVRFVLSVMMRSYYWPPARVIADWRDVPVAPDRSLELGGGFVGPDMEPVTAWGDCSNAINTNTCMRNSKTAIGTYVDYQPIERMLAFQIVEFVLCALIAAGLIAVAFRLLRNGGGWKPSRSHRRLGSPVPDATPAVESPANSDAESAVESPADADAEPAVESPADADAESAEAPEPEAGSEPDTDDQSTPDTAAAKTEG